MLQCVRWHDIFFDLTIFEKRGKKNNIGAKFNRTPNHDNRCDNKISI